MSLVSVNRGEKMYSTFFKCWDINLVFEVKVLRRIFGPKRGKVTGKWKKTTL